MNIHLCGTRGSSVCTGSDYREFGGDTTCIMIRGDGGERVMLDAGSGAICASEQLAAFPGNRSLLILLSHYHLDHVGGLPSLRQIYDADWAVEIAAPQRPDMTVTDAVSRLFAPPYWPLGVGELGAKPVLTDLPQGELIHGSLRVRYCMARHPGGSTSYRIEPAGGGPALVFATDLEWPVSAAAEKAALVRLCSTPEPAALLIFDGQYDRAGYSQFEGWGHSTIEDGVELAEEAGVGRLLITHHDPESKDDALAAHERNLKALLPSARLARQGESIEL